MSNLSPEKLNNWTKELQANDTYALASTVVGNCDIQNAFVRREQRDLYTRDVYNVNVEPQGSPVTKQERSGRCWLFASTNMFRIKLMEKYEIEKLQLSTPHLFFYDKLERANYFLENIIKTANLDVESRMVQHLLSDPISDGGQFGMVVNVLEKYGIVPLQQFGETVNSQLSLRANEMLLAMLREYAQVLRELIANKKDPQPIKEEQMQNIHRIMSIHFGSPLGPNDEFVWDYVDKNKKAHSIKTTPLKFYKEVLEFDGNDMVSLLNDPRNEFKRMIKIDKLGNIAGAPDVSYLNVDIDYLTKKAVARLQSNQPVFFGTHTPIFHHNKTGIIDTKLWDYEKIGFSTSQTKADRLRYHQSLMTHAMLFVGVHLDEDGNPVRWKVENSWGEEQGLKGYYCMSHDFFKEYVYQIVVSKSEIPEVIDVLDTAPVVLDPWDPCGALA